MKHPANRPDPAKLLEAFVASNRCDKAFAALVGSLDGLVYSSALRRTGNAQLAREVAQDVFAIMARKAGSLRRHPSLTAWALKTTRLQSANAMRSERRRQRKIAALTGEATARDSPSSHAMDDQATWKDAVPFLDEALDRLPEQDQKLILQRFYEGKKFREIATQTGQTESACKKRVQRALQKLSSILTSRGVTLSGTTAVASLLGAEFARAVPAQAAAVIAPNALAASSSISGTTLLANTIQTMSNVKTNTLTAAAVLAVLAIPSSRQLAEGSRIRAELRSVADRQVSAVPAAATSKTGRRDRAGTRMASSRTARSILASLNAPADNRAMIRALLEGESLEETMVRSRIAMMSTDELRQLLDDLQAFPCESGSKDLLASSIQRYGRELPPRDQLELMVATGRSSTTGRPMKDWAASEPEAALNWYREKRASGELDPGLSDKLHRQVISSLVCGMATSSPEAALDFYREMPREEMSSSIVRWLASALTKNLMKTGDETWLPKMLEYHGEEDRKKVFEGTFGEFASNGQYDAGLAMVDKYNPDPEERFHYIGRMFEVGLISYQVQDGLDWLDATMTGAEGPEIVGMVIAGYFSGRRHEANQWLERQSPGAMRDHGYAGLVESRLDVRQFEEALGNAEQIDDVALRATSRQMIGQQWLKHDREKAEQGLPAELLKQLQNQ